MAAYNDQADVAKLLLANKANVDTKVGDDAPIHVAARQGGLAVLNVLAENKAKLDAATSDGDNALHLAVRAGHLRVSKRLFELGLDLNSANKAKDTPLHLAVGRDHLEIVEWLVEQKAKQNLKNQDGKTALDLAKELKIDKIIHILGSRR